jgi:hypothetical protein
MIATHANSIGKKHAPNASRMIDPIGHILVEPADANTTRPNPADWPGDSPVSAGAPDCPGDRVGVHCAGSDPVHPQPATDTAG